MRPIPPAGPILRAGPGRRAGPGLRMGPGRRMEPGPRTGSRPLTPTRPPKPSRRRLLPVPARRALATRVKTKPCPGTTPPRRSDSGSACTGRSAASADLEPLERARYELVDPGQGLLPGQLVGEAALGDRALHGAAQEHDDAVLDGDHDPERGDVLRHVADDPGSQTGRDHGGGQLAVRGDGGRQFEELAGRLVGAAGRRTAAPDQDDRVAEPADKPATWLDTNTRSHLFHDASLSKAAHGAISNAETRRPVRELPI